MSEVERRVRRGSLVPTAPDVSVIILVTSTTKRLQRCLDSLLTGPDAPGGCPWEVIVLANATPSRALVNISNREDLVLIRSAINLGFGGGANCASRFARGRYLLFLNDDAVVTPGWVAALVDVAERDLTVGVVGSRVLRPDGRLQEAGSVIWRDGSVWGIGRLLSPRNPGLNVTREVDYVSFCAALVRRQAWLGLHGFDERFYPAYYEDADLCLRARRAGWRVVCAPQAEVIHDEGASTSVRFRTFLSERNQRMFTARWSPSLRGHAPRPDAPPEGMTAAALASLRSRVPSRSASPGDPGAVLGSVGDPIGPSIARARFGPATPSEADLVELERLYREKESLLYKDYSQYLSAQLDGLTMIAMARRTGRRFRRVVARRLLVASRWRRGPRGRHR